MMPVKADIDGGNVESNVLNRPITNIKTPFAPQERDICQDTGWSFFFLVKATKM